MQRAFLYLDPKNPTPDYAAALNELEIYAKEERQGGAKTDIRILIRILRELGKATNTNNSLRTKVAQMEKENQALKETIEQLKSIDIMMEEKRKEVK